MYKIILIFLLFSNLLVANQSQERASKKFFLGGMAIPQNGYAAIGWNINPNWTIALSYRGNYSQTHHTNQLYSEGHKERIEYHSGYLSFQYFLFDSFPMYMTLNLGKESTMQFTSYTLNVDNRILYEKYKIFRSPNYFAGIGPGFKWQFGNGIFIGGESTLVFDTKMPLKTHIDKMFYSYKDVTYQDYDSRKQNLGKFEYRGRSSNGRIDFLFYIGKAF